MKKIVISSKSLLSQTLVLILTLVFCTSALAGGQKRPQIPKHDFVWTSTFRGNETFKGNDEDLSAPQVVEELTVRGK